MCICLSSRFITKFTVYNPALYEYCMNILGDITFCYLYLQLSVPSLRKELSCTLVTESLSVYTVLSCYEYKVQL